MADLTQQFIEADEPLAQVIDNVVLFHCPQDGHPLELSLTELVAFVNKAVSY